MDTFTILQDIYEKVDALDWMSPEQKREFFRELARGHHSTAIPEDEIEAFLDAQPF